MPAVIRDDILFVHIPKSGGTSIGQWLGDKGLQFDGHPNLDMMNSRVRGNPYSFTVVRNPWDRAVSAYQYLFWTQKETLFQNYIDKGKPSFEEFIKSLKNVKVDQVWFNGATPQSEWFKPGVDKVLKFESLEQDFGTIQTLLDDFRPLPHINASTRDKDYRKYFSEETRDIVGNIFLTDITNFDYSF